MRLPNHALTLAALACAASALAQTKALPVTIRDFNAAHPDFQTVNGTCAIDGGGVKGMVSDTLDAERKPIESPASRCPKYELQTWFRDVPGVNKRYCMELPMEEVPGKENTFKTPLAFASAYFPIDQVPGPNPPHALIKAPDPINPALPGETFDGGHNFHFCMEMHATFKYRGGEVFDFKGDDDVWVFVNNRLALDLGGLQNNGAGQVDLDAQQAALKILPGNYYNFDFFFCERQTSESHLQVTTSIDIIPPPAPGLHIADANLNVIPSGDTLHIVAGGEARLFKAVKIETQTQTLDCNNLTSQVKTPATGNWLLNGAALPAGTQATVAPAGLAAGTYKLVVEKDGIRDSVWVTVEERVLAKALGGWYLDRNGDGRIETAVIRYDDIFTVPPKAVAFTDPFAPGTPIPPLSQAAGPGRMVTYTLPPFAPGTGFAAANLAAIAADADFAAQAVSMADSVGPVARAVKAFPTASADKAAAVEIEFSEPVVRDPASLAFPLELKRAMGPVADGDVKVASIEAQSPTRWRITFAPGSKFPVPGDSARLAPSRPVIDAAGNRSDMRFFVPVTGDAARADADLNVGLKDAVTRVPDAVLPRVVPNPVVVHGERTCVNCTDPGIVSVLPTKEPGMLGGLGPTWRVKTKFPFTYSMAFYDNLGQFVNRAEGDVNPQAFELLRRTEAAGDSVLVQLTFLPLSHDGRALGTGAYIMRGVLQIHDQEGIKGSQGETINLVPTERTLVSRFGYVRGE